MNNVYGNFKQLFLLKQQNRNLKVSLSIGGAGSPGFANMNNATYRATFISTSIQMITDFGLDGVDVDWEYPDDSNIESYVELLRGLRTALDGLAAEMGTTPFFLSIAIPAGVAINEPYEKYIPQIDAVLDFWNMMVRIGLVLFGVVLTSETQNQAYDYCGAGWQDTTW